MNMNAQAYDQYKKASVETVAPDKLLLMLFEGALRNINNAKKAIVISDINQAHQQIIRVQDIIIELMSTLNMDYEISHSLLALYEYLLNELVQANVKKDVEILEKVEGFIIELKDTWQEATKELKTPPPKDNNDTQASLKTINVKG